MYYCTGCLIVRARFLTLLKKLFGGEYNKDICEFVLSNNNRFELEIIILLFSLIQFQLITLDCLA